MSDERLTISNGPAYANRSECGWHGPRPVRKDPVPPSRAQLLFEQLAVVSGLLLAAVLLGSGAIWLLTLL